jgi:hypothetical protein
MARLDASQVFVFHTKSLTSKSCVSHKCIDIQIGCDYIQIQKVCKIQMFGFLQTFFDSNRMERRFCVCVCVVCTFGIFCVSYKNVLMWME